MARGRGEAWGRGKPGSKVRARSRRRTEGMGKGRGEAWVKGTGKGPGRVLFSAERG